MEPTLKKQASLPSADVAAPDMQVHQHAFALDPISLCVAEALGGGGGAGGICEGICQLGPVQILFTVGVERSLTWSQYSRCLGCLGEMRKGGRGFCGQGDRVRV